MTPALDTAPLPFIRYDHGGRMMLGRAAQGDATARHGYGPPCSGSVATRARTATSR